MRYFGQDELYILAECDHCGKVLKIKRENLTTTETGFSHKLSLKCLCGNLCPKIEGKPQSNNAIPKVAMPKEVSTKAQLNCRKCKSTNLTAKTKGFSLYNAFSGLWIFGIVGLILFGITGLFMLAPLGLLGGFIGSNKSVFICLNCGNQFEKPWFL